MLVLFKLGEVHAFKGVKGDASFLYKSYMLTPAYLNIYEGKGHRVSPSQVQHSFYTYELDLSTNWHSVSANQNVN